MGMALQFGLEPKSSGLAFGLCPVTEKKGKNRQEKSMSHFQEWQSSALWWQPLKQWGECCRLSCTHMVFAHGDFKGKTLQAPWSCHLLIEMCKKPGRLHGKQHMLRETLEHSMSDELASS